MPALLKVPEYQLFCRWVFFVLLLTCLQSKFLIYFKIYVGALHNYELIIILLGKTVPRRHVHFVAYLRKYRYT
jgi:hypothetical protein